MCELISTLPLIWACFNPKTNLNSIIIQKENTVIINQCVESPSITSNDFIRKYISADKTKVLIIRYKNCYKT